MCLSIAIYHPHRVLSKGRHLGLEWVTTHNGLGYRCGYVRLPLGHPWHGNSYDEIHPEVHGGLTFSEPDVPCDAPGPDTDWWIGFDCGHGGDAPDPTLPLSPEMGSFLMKHDNFGVVRTQEYVEAECINLCKQAVSVTKL